MNASRLAGSRTWSRFFYFHVYPSSAYDTSYYMPDTSFAITTVNDSTIYVWNLYLSYNTPMSNLSSMVFGPSGVYGYKRVYFNYAEDSIAMIDDNSGMGGASYYMYKAKKMILLRRIHLGF